MARDNQNLRPDRDDLQFTACWSEEQFGEACAGVMPEQDAFRLMEHSAGCATCSARLRQARYLFSDDATTEEESLLAALPSSSPATAARIADKFAASRKRPRKTGIPWGFGRWMLPTVSFATVCAVAMLWFGFTRYRAASDDRLLAEAYDAARPYELRIQGSSAGDVASPTRSSNSITGTSTPLLKLKLKFQEQFERDPNKPAVRQMLGRIALVQHNPAEALRDFEMAQVLDPRLSGLAFDLAGAHFALGEITASQSEYDRAIDLFSQYLAGKPADRVALFDRGLAWEHKGAYGRAIADYEAARKDEKDRAWREVLEAHLTRLRALKSYLEQDFRGHHDHDTVDLSTLTQPRPEEYERYVEAVQREWLPQRSTGSPRLREALVGIANLGQERHDLWLSDMLAHSPTTTEIAAEDELAASLNSYEKGDSDGTLSHSAAATILFSRARNLPGQLRADLQHVYGLQSTGKAQGCLEEAARLGAPGQLTRYPAMQIAMSLELAACHGMSGDDTAAAIESQTAATLAQTFSFPGLGLRAAGFVMVYQYAAGRLESSLRTGASALRASANIPGQGVRRFQILHDMEDVARHNRLRFTVLGLAQEGARAAATSGNNRVLAYALEDLALAQSDAGDLDAAGHSFAEADQAVSLLGAAPAASLYRADWQTDRASLTAKQRGVTEALPAMAAAEPQFEHLSMVTPRTRFYTEYAVLLRENGDLTGSIEKAWQATSGTEASLANLRTAAARTGWLESNVRTYQVLIADLNDLHMPGEALAVWHWFRNAPFDTPHHVLTPRTLATEAISLPADATLHLVYARLEDQYVGWSVSAGSPARAQRLSQDPQSLEENTRIFARLCADPRSSRQDLSALGQRLSLVFLGPFQEQLAHASSVELDLDESLISLPFAALPVDSGFFGLTHALSHARPAGSSVARLTAGQQVALRSANLLLLRGAMDRDDPLPAVYDETTSLSKEFPKAAIESVSLIRSGQGIAFAGPNTLHSLLRRAQILHYSGHGLGQAESTSTSALTVFQLSPNSLPHCFLAVIAACRTLGEREDDVDRVSSVARTFLDAGAAQVLATQWDVDSRTTQQTMLALYQQLDEGTPPDTALQHAMAIIARGQQTAHPYYWSAYQIVHRSQISFPRS